MEINYVNKKEDILALVEQQLLHNISYQRKRRWNLYGSPIFLLIAFSFGAYYIEQPSFYIGGGIACIISFIWNNIAYRRYPKKAAEEMQNEVLCTHMLSISASGIKEATKNSENYHTWKAIHKVEILLNYIFIYNTPITAHIIPKRELGEGKFSEFKDEISKYKNT